MGDAKQRAQKGCAAVDRKHPQRGGSFQLEFTALQHIACGVQDLNAPAGNAAVEKQAEDGQGRLIFLCRSFCIHKKKYGQIGEDYS